MRNCISYESQDYTHFLYDEIYFFPFIFQL